MSRSIHVSEPARRALSALDPSLRTELRDHVAEIAERPHELLRRDAPPGSGDRQVFAYDSKVVEGLRFTLVFEGFFEQPESPVLVLIRQSMNTPPGAK